MGRKSKYTPEVVKELVKIIAGGHSHKTACGFVGINRDTFYQWMKKYSDFSDTIKKAENQAKIGLLEKIKKAGDDHWQAAAWILERRWPDEFAQKQWPGSDEDGKDRVDELAKIIAESATRNE